MRYRLAPVRMAITKKKQKMISVGEDVEKRNPCTFLVGMQTDYWHCRKQYEASSKLRMEMPYDQQSHFWVYIQRNRNQDLKEISAAPCSLQHYSQQPGHGRDLSIYRWVNGQRKCNNILHWLLFSLNKKKEENSALCLNMDEPGGHYSKWHRNRHRKISTT